jgi:hypothetical protein
VAGAVVDVGKRHDRGRAVDRAEDVVVGDGDDIGIEDVEHVTVGREAA